MKLSWFQIKNFRSIVDSGKCYINDNLTIFAGKNESGKSNILKALQAFQDNNFDKEYDFPNSLSAEPPEITICYSISEMEIQRIMLDKLIFSEEYKFEVSPTNKTHEIVVSKTVGAATTTEGSYIEYTRHVNDEEYAYWEKQLIKTIKLLMKNIELIDNSISQQLNDYFTENEYIAFAETLFEFYDVTSLDENSPILKVLDNFDSLNSFSDSKKYDDIELPKLILFSSFTDLLPDKANRTTAASSTIIQRFFKIVGISEEVIFDETSKQKRKLLVNDASSKITGDFSSFYQQNSVDLSLDIDGDELSFYLYEKNNVAPFKPDQRSQGFQWFLSFYITLVAEQQSAPNIILLDEPGLYLHAKAQQDMLRVLESLSKENQILMTTHSPYLIDTDRLDRLKLVMRNDKSTYIENKFHKVSDRDTLTPIITALGYDLSTGISFNSNTNIIVEGISDYYYILAMKNYLGVSQDFTIIPSIGVDQIPNIAAILLGWGVPFICLLDQDKQGKIVSNKLKKIGLDEDKEYIFVGDTKLAIEDLFSANDFHKFILLESTSQQQTINISNSILAGNRKAILSRGFYDRVSSINKSEETGFDQTTIDNFRNLFNKISDCSAPNKIAQ
ncbi:AAA family ATPase [Paenibacillus sp. PK1-4R]|uniref:ATP-dependent nuclease n=1 Tax=Paenibacillus sp. PK1-4R TaxID=3049075 RepID=UPI0025A20F0D|nr:AAA family ATPase [Paenibacillus sp. PK1-4R]WJM07307.1 AAA family ATPase [Paenibacillus sp. PK1-4R]